MKAEQLRDYSKQDLQELESKLKRDLFMLKMKKGTGQLQNTASLKEKKRDIARVKTVLRERELGLERG